MFLAVGLVKAADGGNLSPQSRFDALEYNLAKGWNTWDTRSVLTHVYLPYGFAVELSMIDSQGHKRGRVLVGERGEDAPKVTPGNHAYDGSLTSLTVAWHGMKFRVESAAEGTTQAIVVTPLEGNEGGTLVVAPKSLWVRSNRFDYQDEGFSVWPQDKSLTEHGRIFADSFERRGHEYHVPLMGQAVITVGEQPVEKAEALELLDSRKQNFDRAERERFGADYDCYHGMQSVLAWDCIYDPSIRKVITPVSRIWSSSWFASSDFGGFTLFCWDTFFASMMLGVDNRDLAYSNLVTLVKAITETGFIPNCYYSNGFKSRDRSQPPVGALATWTLYQQYHDRWFLELVYPELLSWNRWWVEHRMDDGLICLGSEPYEKITYFHSEYDANTRYGAILESGLDNSQMYDAVKFDPATHLTNQQDVGMSSLYVMDCHYLNLIAQELGKKKDAREIAKRGKAMGENLMRLWCAEDGYFYNRNTDTGEFNKRTSPTNFYPLLAGVATPQQAEAMISRHLLNPEEFWGEYVITSTPRNDPAYHNNDYWRGRIWAPLNFLVYMGLKKSADPQLCREFAGKSRNLFLQSWLKDGYVFENYNPDSGQGDDVNRSDKFYHWGALLAYISLIENNLISID